MAPRLGGIRVWGLFSKGYLSHFSFRAADFIAFFGSAGKIGTRRAQPDLRQQNRRSPELKTGVWSVDLGFSPHFRKRLTEVCGKFRNPRAHYSFHEENPQVEMLSLSGVGDISTICRILPDWALI